MSRLSNREHDLIREARELLGIPDEPQVDYRPYTIECDDPDLDQMVSLMFVSFAECSEEGVSSARGPIVRYEDEYQATSSVFINMDGGDTIFTTGDGLFCVVTGQEHFLDMFARGLASIREHA